MPQLSQRIIWTALPDGISDDGRYLLVNVHVAPRLVAELGPGEPEARLADFPAFARWAGIVNAAELQVMVNGEPVPTERVMEADDTLWQALFPSTTPVRSRRRERFHQRRILSYPLAALAGRIERDYAELAANSETELPELARLVRDNRWSEFYVPREPLALDKALNLLESGGDEPDDEALLPQAIGLLQAYHTPLDQPLEVVEDNDEEGNPNERARWRSIKRVDLPTPAALAVRYDFHERLSALADHVELSRRAGMVVPLRIARSAVPRGEVSLALQVAWNTQGLPTEADVLPATQAQHAETHFTVVARSPLVREGWLMAAAPGFRLVALDVDGAGMSLKNAFGAMPALLNDERRNDDSFGYRSPARGGLPRLRTAGLQFAHQRRDRAVRQLFQDANGLEDQLDDGSSIKLYAEDVTRGWRVEVARVGTERWQSLMRYDADYRLTDAGSALNVLDQEAWIQLGATSSADGSNAEVLKLTESLFAWSGWSLAAPEPGRTILPDVDESHGDSHGDTPEGLPLDSRLSAHPGSLPTLRFGHEYVVRLRLADVAGGGLRWNPAAESPEGSVSRSVYFGRYEPVEGPAIALVDGDADPADGESMHCAALRRTEDPAHANASVRRLLAPPRVGQRFAEMHGVLDNAEGRPDPSWYQELRTRDRAFETRVVETPAYLPEQPDEPPAQPVMVETSYATAAADGSLPYLPDPLAAGIAVRILDHLEFPSDRVIRLPFAGSEWDPDREPPWPDVRPVLLEAVVDGELEWDAESRTLRVPLRPSDRVRVRLSALVPRSGIKLFKLFERTSALQPEALAKMLKLLEDGQHWMYTPWHELVLVHAVQRPLITPRLDGMNAQRGLAETAAEIYYSTPIHAPSTERLDVLGQWIEIDDMRASGPVAMLRQDVAFSRRLARREQPDNMLQRDKGRHEFTDTRARRVFYTGVATTRFREFMPPVLRDQTDALIVRSAPERLWVRSSSPPPPPLVRYVIPTFGWQERPLSGNGRELWRRGGGLRVYLDRPWFASGSNEMLAVLLPQVVNDGPPPELEPYLTQWGADPLWLGGQFQTAAPRPADFPRRVPPEGPIPYEVDFQPAAEDLEVPDVAPEGTDFEPTGQPMVFTPAGAPDAVKVEAVPHAVGYDSERALWFCDIVVRPGNTYCPFIELALARYQPHSEPSCHLSSVVKASFQQLFPDRLVIMTPLEQRRVRVDVFGQRPSASSAVPTAGNIQVQVQRLPEDGNPELDWVDAPASGLRITPTLMGAAREVAAGAGSGTRTRSGTTISPQLQQQLNKVLPAFERGDLSVMTRYPGLEALLRPQQIASVELSLPEAGRDKLRLLVTETELYDDDVQLLPVSSRTQRQRVVFMAAIKY